MEIDNSSSSNWFDCPNCLQGYTTQDRIPKIFTCGHSVCLSCTNGGISNCPICCQVIDVQTIKNLPTNFPLLQIIENMEKKPKACPQHPNYAQDHYCVDDKSLICLYCSTYGSHKGHNIQGVGQFENQLHSALQQMEEDFSKVDSFLESDVEKLKLNVINEFNQILTFVATVKDNVLKQIEQSFEEEYILRKEKLQAIEDLKDVSLKFKNDPIQVIETPMTFAASLPVDSQALEAKIERVASNIFLPIHEMKKAISCKFQVEKVLERDGVDINILCGNEIMAIKVQVTDTVEKIKNRLSLIYPQLRDQVYELVYNRKVLRGNGRVSDYNIQSYIPLEITFAPRGRSAERP